MRHHTKSPCAMADQPVMHALQESGFSASQSAGHGSARKNWAVKKMLRP